MVFRRPYGFLIKHFKLIHLIISFILVYVVSCNNQIYSYLNDCISNSSFKYNALEYINYNIYIWIGITLLLFFIIYWLFKYKDKPRGIYIISILGYILVGIYMFVLFSYFTGLPNDVVDQKVIRAYRDIMLITLGFQYLIIIIMFIRGFGFDIKKFNFGKDIHELNLTDEDGEEIEVDVNIDTNRVFRGIRKRKRELGYFFNEYKVIILGIIVIILVIVGYNSYNYLQKVFKVYNQGDVIGSYNYITIDNSYYKIDGNKNYVIVRFDIYKNGKNDRLDVNNMVLEIDNNEYLPNKNICYMFNYLGNCYKKQYITNNNSSYMLVYEVDNLNIEKSYLLYKESYDNLYKVKLNLENYE